MESSFTIPAGICGVQPTLETIEEPPKKGFLLTSVFPDSTRSGVNSADLSHTLSSEATLIYPDFATPGFKL